MGNMAIPTKKLTAITLKINILQMNILKSLLFLATISILTSCAINNKLTTQLRYEADMLFAKGEYAEAYNKYMQIDLNNYPFDSILYRNISITAYNIKKYDTTCQYGSKISHINDTTLTFALYESFDSINKPDNAILLIEENQKIFEDKYSKDIIINKLAYYYNTTKDYKLTNIYKQINSSTLRSQCFENYFKLIKDSTTEKDLLNICKEAIKDNPKQIIAIDFIAISLYNTGEAKYNAVMNDYNKNKNATTYAYLRRDLKRISTIYVEAKTHFETLRKLVPDEKNYIRYLINIYNRLDQNDKAKSLKKLL